MKARSHYLLLTVPFLILTLATTAFLSPSVKSVRVDTGNIDIHHQSIVFRPKWNTYSNWPATKDNQDASSRQCNDSPLLPSRLPVFPLRKSVKLPTESLTLNLYESRYLAMAESILNNTNRNGPPMLFGAIYCSDKPQVVAGGVSPIVPMYDIGDIGAVFAVEHSEEGVHTDDENKNVGGQQRRIRIVGVAIGRFSIKQILHNGYGGGDVSENNKQTKKEDPLPYIVVEPKWVWDAPVQSHEEKRIRQFEKKFQNIMKERLEVTPMIAENCKHTTSSNSSQPNEEEEEEEEEGDNAVATTPSIATTMNSWSPTGTTRRITPYDFMTGAHANNAEQMKLSDHEEWKELFSFAAILTLLPDRLSRDMQRVMQMTSTLERWEYLDQHWSS